MCDDGRSVGPIIPCGVSPSTWECIMRSISLVTSGGGGSLVVPCKSITGRRCAYEVRAGFFFLRAIMCL